MQRAQRDTALFSEPGQGKATVTQNGFPRRCIREEINKHTGAFMKNESHSSLLQTDPVWACVPSVITNNAPLILKTLISKCQFYVHCAPKLLLSNSLEWHSITSGTESKILSWSPYLV